MKAQGYREIQKTPPKVNVGKSRLYKYLQNQLVIMTFIIQTAIVITYLTVWFSSQVLIQTLLKSNIGTILHQSGKALVQTQALNGKHYSLEQYQEMDRYVQAFTSTLNYLQDPRESLPEMLALDEMEESTPSMTVAYWIDGREEQPQLENLPVADAFTIEIISGYLLSLAESLDKVEGDPSPLIAIGILNSSALSTLETVTGILPLKNYFIEAKDDEFFSFANNCTEGSKCLQTCVRDEKYYLDCTSQGKGIVLSPFTFSVRNGSLEDKVVYLHMWPVSDKVTLLLFFLNSNLKGTPSESLYAGSKTALMMEACLPSNGCILEPHLIVESRVGRISTYKRDRNDNMYARFLKSFFSTLDASLLRFSSGGRMIEADISVTTFEGLRGVGLVSMPIEVVTFLDESEATEGPSFTIDEELGQVAILILMVFILGVATLFYFIYRSVAVILQSLIQIRNFMLEGSPFDLSNQTVKHVEMNAMLKEIKYYQMVVSFIKTIKGKDSNNREELSKFVKPIEASKNLSAQVYLFNFFMKELSEKSMEKPAPRRDLEDVDDETEKVSELDLSIQYGLKLYSSSFSV